jgi:hypothetical protein
MVLDGYVRVSQVQGRSGERFMSPVVQREQIERWAQLRGAFIGHLFEELDESGGRSDRPLLSASVWQRLRSRNDVAPGSFLALIDPDLSHIPRPRLRQAARAFSI